MFTYIYPRPALTVDAIVVAGAPVPTHFLLVKRSKDPFKGKWALPGGFVDMEETLEKACIRELKEETGLELPAMEQLRVYDAPERDPRHRTISVVFYAFIPEMKEVQGGDDASEAAWFPAGRLPELAFDHGQIVADFRQRYM